jgi:hypothetical protein
LPLLADVGADMPTTQLPGDMLLLAMLVLPCDWLNC